MSVFLLPICVHVDLSTYLSACVFAYLCARVFVCLSVRVPVYQCV